MKTEAQTTWASAASGNWNTAASWNPAVVPGVGTNTFVTNSGTFTVTYNSPMAAASISGLTLGLASSSASVPTLTITASGFNVSGTTAFTGTSAGVINVNGGGVMNNGTLNFNDYNAVVNVTGIMTNATTQVDNNSSNDGNGALKISPGGVANLGNVIVGRNNQGTGQGFIVSGGTVYANSIAIGTRNSYATMAVSSGTVTNSGSLQLGTGTATSGREVRYYQTGGTVNCAGTVDLSVTANFTSWFSVLNSGSTFSADGIRVFPNAVSGLKASITNSGSIYLGASGFNVLNSGTTTISLAGQSILGATADWTGNANMTLAGANVNLNAADLSGTPHNITLTGVLSGSGGPNKIGGGGLLLNNANTYTGATTINAGSIFLEHAGALPNGTALSIGTGTLDLAGFNAQVSSLSSFAVSALITNSSFVNASTLVFSNSAAGSAFGGTIAGGNKPINLTVLGGNLTLSGQNNYSGNIFLSNGKLALNGASSTFTGPAIVLSNSAAILDLTGMSTLNLAAGQSLSGYGAVTGSVTAANCTIAPGLTGVTGTLTISGNLTVNGGVTHQFDLSLDPNSGDDQLNVGGSLNLSGVNVIKINPLASSLFQGTYHLITCASVGGGDTNNLQLVGSPGSGLQAALSMTATGVDLVVSASGGSARLWVGDGSANLWDLTSTNWLNGGLPDTFTNGNFVSFDDGSTNEIVNLTGTLQPAGVTVDAAANYTFQGSGTISGTVSFTKTNSGTLTVLTMNDYNGVTTLAQGPLQVGNGIANGSLGSGALVDNGLLVLQQPASSTLSNAISGVGGLVQAGAATLTLAGTNTFSGGITINSGTLQIGTGGTIGSGNVTNNAALVFNNGVSNNVVGIISGSGSLTVLSGTVALAGNDTYSGNTVVSGGTLLVNNAIGTGAVTIGSGGTLGGSGTIGGSVTINSGGVLTPGNPVGTLIIASNLTMNSGSVMNFSLGASNDRVAVGNDLSLTGTLNITNAGTLGSGTYTLFTYGGNLLASSITLGSVPSGKLYSIDTSTPGQVNVIIGTIATNVPAFPGAYGFGSGATGGRGGTIYHVTTLADSGTGSFRDAVSKSGRIVVFDVGGYIALQSAVSVHGNTTIAGQTAPGGGIGFEGGEISFAGSSNIICRYIRIRPGSDTASTGDDCLSLYQATNCIIDHATLEFGPWNNIDAVGCAAITVQNSIDANPIYQQFGAHTESVGQNFSWFYNIFANTHNRNPLAKINTVFINNILYNYQAGYTTHTSTPFRHDIVNNYFIMGPGSGGTDNTWFQIDNNQSMYFTGNLEDNNLNGTLDGFTTVPLPGYQGGGTILSSPWSTWTTNVPIYSQISAYRIAMSQAGALPRDEMDSLLLSQIKTLGNGPAGTGTGTTGPGSGLYTSQTSTGLGNNGYGNIAAGAPSVDSDSDGLPDFWELAVGLDPANPNDSTNMTLSGYTQLEIYLNWLAGPHAVANTNVVNVDLSQYASGFTNANPVYTVSKQVNGTVSLLPDGHTAQFTTASNYGGQSSFVFTVAGNDGSRMTNTVGLVISSVPPPQNLLWRGDGSANTWDVGTNANWLNGTNLSVFDTGDTVTFDDTGSNNTAINLSGTLKPSSVTVAANQDYTFGGTGTLAGVMPLIKSGSGNLTLNTANTYGGGTVVQGGTVTVANGGSVGGGDVSLDGGTLTSTYGPTTTYNLAGSVNVPSAGTLNLSPRMTLNGISGNGVLNMTVPGGTFNYENLNGAAYGSFTGTLNITGTAPGALVTLNFNGGLFDGNLGSTLLNLDNVTLEGRHNSGGNTLTIGALSGTSTSSLGGSDYAGNETINIGGLNLNTTFAGSILNGAATTTVNKNGTGALTLSGTNNFTGGLNVNNGSVYVNGTTTAGTVTIAGSATVGGSGSIGGPVTLQAGASLRPAGTLMTAGNLTLTGAKLYFDLANVTTPGAGGNDLISISGGTLTLSGTSTVFPNYVNGALANGTYTLISGGSATTGSGANLAWSGPSNTRQTVAFDTSTPGTVLLNVSGSLPASLVWQGTNGNNWDLTTVNWLNGGAADKFYNVDSVLFDDTSTNGNVTVAASVQPGSIVVNNAALAYAFSGSLIIGSGSLIKNGTGTLTISNANSFSGGAIVNNGTVALGSDLANSNGLGSGPITLNGGTLTMFNSAATDTAGWNLIVPLGATGNLNADSRCTLTGTVTGGGTLNFNVTSTQTALAGDWSGFSGRVNVSGGGEFRVLNFAGYPSAAISLSNNVTADFQGTVDPNGTTLAIGELSGPSSARLLGGSATNGDVLTWSIGGKNTDATFAGQIGEQLTNANTAIQKIGTGRWTLTGSNSYNGGTLVSGGTLLLNNTTGSATGSGDVEVVGGSTVRGTGSIAGSISVDAAATFAPGNPTGTLTIGSDLALDPAASLQFTLGSSSSSANVAGSLQLAGGLNVLSGAGFGPGTYTLFTYGGTLNVNGLTIASVPGGYSYTISTNTPGKVQLIVGHLQFDSARMTGGQFVMSGSGGVASSNYYVLSSTNLILPLNLWLPLATNQFDSNGNFTFTNSIGSNTVRQFYLLQSP